MTSQHICTSRISQVLTLASLQRLKMEVPIPAPTDCTVRSIKVYECTEHSPDWNSSSAEPGLWPHAARRPPRLLQEFSGEMFNYYPPYSPDFAPSDFHLFLHLNKFMYVSVCVFWMTETEMSVTVVPIPGGRLLRHRMKTWVPRYDKFLDSGCEYVEK